MKLAAALAVAVTLALPASTGAAGERVLGIDTTVLGMRLGWYDPATLTRLSGKTVPLVSHEGPWSLSPNGKRLAIAGRAGDVRFIDLQRMSTQGSVSLRVKKKEVPTTLAWPRSNRVLVAGGTFVAVVDPQRLRLVHRASLPGSVDGAAALRDGLALLLAPAESGFAPARIAVVDTEGRVRTATLDRITVGFRQSGDTYDMRRAGFAVDRGRASRLRRGRRRHDRRRRSARAHLLLSRRGVPLRREAAARPAANGSMARQRSARRGRQRRRRANRARARRHPRLEHAGARPQLEDVTVSAGALVGSSWVDFAVYGADGTQRYRSAPAGGVELQVAGRYGYACHGATLSYVVELATGASVSASPRRTCVTVLAR